MNRSILPPWTPFSRGVLPTISGSERLARAQAIADDFGCTLEKALAGIDSIKSDDSIYLNSRYQVNVRRVRSNDGQGPDMVHLSIKRLDKEPLGPERYRDFMRIKDELIGPECEGVELLPARSREVDIANQYHVWVVDSPTFRFQFGYDDGRHVKALSTGDKSGARQSPFEKHHPI